MFRSMTFFLHVIRKALKAETYLHCSFIMLNIHVFYACNMVVVRIFEITLTYSMYDFKVLNSENFFQRKGIFIIGRKHHSPIIVVVALRFRLTKTAVHDFIMFVGHATAEDMVQHFNTGVINSGLNIKNMVQISMDGPNVNWKFYDMMKVNLSEEFHTTPVNIGSCGIHTVHNSFKAGVVATEWSISPLLSSLYYHFKDSPARREDYVKVTGNSQLPLKFVSNRWLENVVVSERALNSWRIIEAYVKAVQENRIPNPGNKSFQVIKEAVDDKLILVKLHFLKCIASELQPFLANYQTDKPMVCFLATDLSTLLRALMTPGGTPI